MPHRKAVPMIININMNLLKEREGEKGRGRGRVREKHTQLLSKDNSATKLVLGRY